MVISQGKSHVESHVLSTAFFSSSSSITCHLSPVWKLLRACLPPVGKEQTLNGLQNPSGCDCRSSGKAQASVPGLKQEGFGVKGKAG